MLKMVFKKGGWQSQYQKKSFYSCFFKTAVKFFAIILHQDERYFFLEFSNDYDTLSHFWLYNIVYCHQQDKKQYCSLEIVRSSLSKCK